MAGRTNVITPINDPPANGIKIMELLSAADQGNTALVAQIISSGTSVNAVDYDRRAAIHLAACGDHVETINKLIELGCDYNVKDRWDRTPLDDAIQHNSTNAVKVLVDLNAQLDVTQFTAAFLQAAAEGNTAECKKYIDAGVRPDVYDYDRRTPLHVAMAENHIETASYLIEAGADLYATDRFGTTPLQEAQRHDARIGTSQMSLMLREHGATIGHSTAPIPSFGIFALIVQAAFIILFWLVTEYGDGAAPLDVVAKLTAPALAIPAVPGIPTVPGEPSALAPTASTEYKYRPTGVRKRFRQMHVQASEGDETPGENIINGPAYSFFQDVHVMMFIGFGFLMTFLRKYGYSAIGFTMVIAAVTIQWHILVEGFFGQIFHETTWHKVGINLGTLLIADFAAAAVLITYGAVLGRVSPSQMLVIGLIEILVFTVNENIGIQLRVTDVGGSMVVHCFGAYFGLACSRGLLWATPWKPKEESFNENAAVYRSDLFAMIGTVFLWMFWPSFNAAPAEGEAQHRAIVNTVLALTGSCICAFIASCLIRPARKFDMVDVQNATLAGGVAMGTSANLLTSPGGAVSIGAAAGILSVIGYVWVSDFLTKYAKLLDTCGVNNLHGMPSVFGALVGVIMCAIANEDDYGADFTIFGGRVEEGWSASKQAQHQLFFLAITLAMAIVGGLLTGLLVGFCVDRGNNFQYFSDDEWWECPHVEKPYYFDQRGEVARGSGNASAWENRLVQLERRLEGITVHSSGQSSVTINPLSKRN